MMSLKRLSAVALTVALLAQPVGMAMASDSVIDPFADPVQTTWDLGPLEDVSTDVSDEDLSPDTGQASGISTGTSTGFNYGVSQSDIEGADRMLRLGLVQGRGGGDLALGSSITRAELVTIMVRALGLEFAADVAKGTAVFPDVPGDHWASGYIAVARNLAQKNGFTIGFPDGTFGPDTEVTPAQALAFEMKFLGITEDKTQAWPNSYVAAARRAGIIDATDVIVDGIPALRGQVFGMADKAFSTYVLPSGKTVYAENIAAYRQNVAVAGGPIITVGALPTSTKDAKVSLSGSIQGATTAAALVGDVAMPLNLGENGSFLLDVDLAYGANEVLIEATDLIGQVSSKTFTITRQAGEASAIEVNLADSLVAGSEIELKPVVKDDKGYAIPDQAFEVAVEESLGVYENGKLKVATEVGSGKLTITSGSAKLEKEYQVVAGEAVKLLVTPSTTSAAPGTLITFTVEGLDAYDNKVAVSGVTYEVDNKDGALIESATGNMIASKPGTYVVTAKSGDLTGTVSVGVFGEVAKLVIEGADKVIGNDETKVKFTVKAVDNKGHLVGSASDTVDLWLSSGAGDLLDEKGNVISSVDLKNGVGTFYIRGSSYAWGLVADLEASLRDDSDVSGEVEIAIEEQVATSIAIAEDSAKFLAANHGTETATVKVNVLDQAGAPMKHDVIDVDWVLTGPAVEFGTDDTEGSIFVANGEGSLVLQSDQGDTGTISVVFSAHGLGKATASVRAVIAQKPAAVTVSVKQTDVVADDTAAAAGSAAEITLTIVDKNGVPVESGEARDLAVTFGRDLYFSGVNLNAYVNADAIPDLINTHKVVVPFAASDSTVTFLVGTSKAGTFDFTVTDSASKLKSAKGAITVAPAGAGFVGLSRTDRFVVSQASPKGQVKVELLDEFGNKVSKSGVSVTLTAYDSADSVLVDAEKTDMVRVNGAKTSNSAKTDANGVATFDVEVLPYTDRNFKLAITDVSTGYTIDSLKSVVPVEVTFAMPSKVNVTILKGGNRALSVDAGDEVTIAVTVEDAYGTKLTGYEDLLEIVLTDGEWDADGIATTNDRDVDAFDGGTAGLADDWDTLSVTGEYQMTAYAAKAGRATFTVKLPLGNTTLTGSASVTVRAGEVANVKAAEANADGELSIVEKRFTPITLRLADAWGNERSGDVTYYVALEIPSDVTVRLNTSGVDLASYTETDLADGVKRDRLIALRSSQTLHVLVEDFAGSDKTVVIRGVANTTNDDMIDTDTDTALDDYTLTIMKSGN